MPDEKPNAHPEQLPGKLRYLALGDSYTIGEGEALEFTYPMQTVRLLKSEGIHFSETKIIAQTGWSSAELLAGLKQKKLKKGSFDYVSLLIGVNNQYRGLALDQFKLELRELVEISMGLVSGNNHRMVLISIPDWGVTPFGHSGPRKREDISREIDAFNRLVEQQATDFNIPYLEITESYRASGGLADQVVADGLHPSKHTYAAWARSLCQIIKQGFQQ